MTYTLTKTESTVPIGGNLNLRVYEMDVSNYDDDTGGDGEAFAPVDANMRRFVYVGASETSAAAQWAKYDEATGAVRLYNSSGEVGSDGGNTGTVKLFVVGV
jgi:hypothetical protein